MHKLTEDQIRAISILAGGQWDIEVEKEVGITQQTLTQWRTNPVFEAALNRARLELLVEWRHFRNEAAQQAFEVTLQALKSKSEAIRLKAAALLLQFYKEPDDQPPTGPTDPEEVMRRRQAAIDRDINERIGRFGISSRDLMGRHRVEREQILARLEGV